MIELLRLCGFGAQEIESELPRIEKAFGRLGITAEDIERGKQRLNKYYDIELKGVRKVFRLLMWEVIESVMARDDGKTKIVNGFMAPGTSIIGCALMSKSKEVFSAHHGWAFMPIVGCIFGKIVPVLEAAEKKWLKAGAVSHCSNVKTYVGMTALNMIPKPDLLMSSGFLCETAPKTLDLLHELYDISVFNCFTCQDREFGEYLDGSKRAINLAATSTRSLTERIREVVGFEITDDMLWEALNAKKKLDDAIRKLRDLIANSDPLPIGPAHENLLFCVNNLTMSIDRMPVAVDAINTLYEELQERVDKGIGVVEKGAPRVLCILPPGGTDPILEHLASEVGIAMVATDNRFLLPDVIESEDPYVVMSLHLLSSMANSPSKRIPLIIDVCKELNVVGVFDRYHVGCRTVAGDAMMIKKAVEKELGIPVLLLEWENFDPRTYNHEEFRRRLEVFKMMMIKKSA
jgi:benzoyl-CoA reductase/2-hydroxyglutaryl-CoA dehydratase subunit BcrC/BadD/HgdB